MIGPQFITASDVLAKLIAEARGKLAERHYAPDPVLVEKQSRRRLYSYREAQRQREANG